VVGFWELMFVGKPDLLSPLDGGGLSEVLFWTIVLAPALPEEIASDDPQCGKAQCQ